jgi:hypothetical protein
MVTLCSPSASWEFWISERHSELIQFSHNLQFVALTSLIIFNISSVVSRNEGASPVRLHVGSGDADVNPPR